MTDLNRQDNERNKFQAKLTGLQKDVRHEATSVFDEKKKATYHERRRSQVMRRSSEVLVEELKAHEHDDRKEAIRGILKLGGSGQIHATQGSPLEGEPQGLPHIIPSHRPDEVQDEISRHSATQSIGEVLQGSGQATAKAGWLNKLVAPPDRTASASTYETEQTGESGMTGSAETSTHEGDSETSEGGPDRGADDWEGADEPSKRAESAIPKVVNWSKDFDARFRSKSNPTTPSEEDMKAHKEAKKHKERPKFQYKRKKKKAEATPEPELISIRRRPSNDNVDGDGKVVTKRKKDKVVVRRKSITWEPLPPDQLEAVTSTLQNFLAQLDDGQLVETMTKSGDLHDEDEKVEEVVFALFATFASSVNEKSSKHAHSMDLEEYLNCMETLGLVPAATTKKDVIQLFRDVNNVSVSDYDKHEMSQFEFLRSLEILSKRIGLRDISELVLVEGEEEGGDQLSPFEAVDRGVRGGRSTGSVSSTGTFLANVRDLSDLDLKNMQALLKVFRERSADTASQPELDMESFVDVFLPVLKLEAHELQMLFMKIDVNSDGIVTWNEFSSFVLDLHTKNNTATDGDSVFDGTRQEEMDTNFHHDESVACICYLERHGQLVSACANGFIRSWQQSSGACVGKPLNRSIKAVPSTSSVLCMTVLSKCSLLTVGSEDAKIRLFDGQSLRHELTLDCNGRLPMVMTTFLFPTELDPAQAEDPQGGAQRRERLGAGDALERKQMSGWLVWGDNCGDLHMVPEEQLVAFRTPQETVPVFQSSLVGLWDLKIFPPHETGGMVVWCTASVFIPDIGLNGVLVVAGSNGWVAVVSVELKTVLHYYSQHRLGVKTVEWCGRQNNILASAGLDRSVHLWRPAAVKFGKPTLAGNLKGHSSGVLDLVFHDQRDVLFSLDSHSIVLVWDLASRTMLGRLTPLSQNPFDITHKVTRLLVAGPNRHLVTATNHPRLWSVKPLDLRDESEKLVPHNSEVVATLYNTNFDHLLTVDRAGFVAIWQVTNGAQVLRFMCEEVPEFFGAPDATAASFDLSERRLVVGWSQGSIQLYNFSNGTLLNNLVTETSSPVVSVMQIEYSRGQDCHRHFVAALEDGVILQWPNKMKERNALPVRKIEVPAWMGTEFMDVPITCFAFGHPHTLVTGRKDGIVLEWDMQTGFLMKNEHGTITLRCTDSAKIPIHATTFLHKLEHICVASDSEGNVHFLDCDGGKKLGSVRGKRPRVVYSGIQALEIDATDSFLFAGDTLGYLQVWDISQMFDADHRFHLSMCIDVFRWKAHDAAISRIAHMSKYNLLLTASHEPGGSAGVWSVTGEKLGLLGQSKWSAADIERVVDAVPKDDGHLEAEVKEDLGGEKSGRGLELWGSKVAGQMSSFRMSSLAADGRTESEDSQPADGQIKGQLSLTIRSLSHLPNRDRNSKSDPYCIITISGHKQRRTRVIENQNNVRIEEQFLYYIEGLDRSLQVEVWDYDSGGLDKHDFIGQVVMRLESLLIQNNAEEGVMLNLTRKDGKTSLKEGAIVIAAHFTPVASSLEHRNGPKSVQEHIKTALVGPQVAPVPPLRFLATPAVSQSVTALATARWDSVDFRSLSVYQLQDETKVAGFATERSDRKSRWRKDGGVDSRRGMERVPGESLKGLSADTHKFSKESLAGRLERSLDATFADAYTQPSLMMMEASATVSSPSRRAEPLKKGESPSLRSIGDALRILSTERKKMDSQDANKKYYRRSSLVASANPAALEQLHSNQRFTVGNDSLGSRRRGPPSAQDPLLGPEVAGGPRRKAAMVARGGDSGGVSLPRIETNGSRGRHL